MNDLQKQINDLDSSIATEESKAKHNENVAKRLRDEQSMDAQERYDIKEKSRINLEQAVAKYRKLAQEETNPADKIRYLDTANMYQANIDSVSRSIDFLTKKFPGLKFLGGK